MLLFCIAAEADATPERTFEVAGNPWAVASVRNSTTAHRDYPMKIKFTKAFAGFAAGSTATFPEERAKDYIKRGVAVEADVESTWVKALVDLPQFAKKAGDIFSIDDKTAREELLSEQMAESAADPTKSVIERVIGDLSKSIEDSVNASVEKALAEATAKASKGVRDRIPAIPKNDNGLNGFDRPEEFWRAVKMASGEGGTVDKRLVEKTPQGGNTLTGEEGGFLVPPQISNTILELAFPQQAILNMTDSEAIGSPSIVLNAVKDASRATGSRRGGVRGYWIEQADQFTKSKPEWRQMTLRPYKLGVLCYCTEEQLTDTNIISLPGKLAQYAAEEIRFLTHDAIFNGTGVGQPTGIIEHASTVTVTPETGQAADTIRFENLVKMRSRFLRVGGSAAWFANVDTLPQLYSIAFPTSNIPLLLNVGAGTPSLGQEMQQTLMGLPIYFTEHNQSLGTKGDIMLCDLKAYKTVTRGTVNSAVSIHVRFEYEETAFRFSYRVDGQPWLDSAITPFKGSATLSPFVQLADR